MKITEKSSYKFIQGRSLIECTENIVMHTHYRPEKKVQETFQTMKIDVFKSMLTRWHIDPMKKPLFKTSQSEAELEAPTMMCPTVGLPPMKTPCILQKTKSFYLFIFCAYKADSDFRKWASSEIKRLGVSLMGLNFGEHNSKRF